MSIVILSSGIGNSGVDIAVDLSHTASQVGVRFGFQSQTTTKIIIIVTLLWRLISSNLISLIEYHHFLKVYLSTRRGAWVVSRKGFWGYPADAIANSRFLFTLPKSVLQWSVEKMCSFNFDHEAYGVKPSQRYGNDHQIKRALK